MSPHDLFLGIVTTALGLLAIYKHKANIQRLMEWHGEPARSEKSGGREMKITVLGAGAWGTALAKLLNDAQAGHEVILWGHDAAQLREVQSTGRNERYLPGIVLPREMRFEADLSAAIADAEGRQWS